ncbi:MAG: DNA glycosylase [Methanomassiliicoccales archaeon]
MLTEESRGTETSILLNVKGPFDLARTIECGQIFKWQKQGNAYLGVEGGHLLKVEQKGQKLKVGCTPTMDRAALRRLVGDIFRFDDDLPLILSDIGRDDHIKQMIGMHSGLRLMRQDPWECMLSYLCSINSNIPRITRDVQNIASVAGKRVSGHDTFHQLPTPQEIVELGEEGLRKLGVGFRARFIYAAARRLIDERLELMELRRMKYDEAYCILEEFEGIGPKVADCILLFSLDKLESFPVDRWVKRGLEEIYFSGRKVSIRELREWSRYYFGRYAGYAQQYLFHQTRTMNRSAAVSTEMNG